MPKRKFRNPDATEAEIIAEKKDVNKGFSGLQPTKPKMGNPLKQIPAAVKKVTQVAKKVVYPQVRPANAAEELSYRRQGEREFYVGLEERNKKRRAGRK